MKDPDLLEVKPPLHKDALWNVYKQMESMIDEWQTTGDQKNSLELSAQVS